jgi:hypothetical protein
VDLEKIEFAPRPVGPIGLGGWLILPLLGLFVTLFVVGAALVTDVIPLISGPSWSALTTPGSPVFHSSWAPYIIASLVSNIVLFVGSIALLLLAFQKKRLFPLLMVAFYLTIVATSAVDLWAYTSFLKEVLPDEVAANASAVTREFARSIVGCLIWIPYFMTSKRVQNTFVQ